MADRATARSISRTLPRSSSRISRWFSPGSRPWGFVVISIPFGGAQLRAAGPRVRLDLVHRGSQRSSCQQRDQVGRSASAPGEAPGADTAVRETAQRRLDEAIFEGVEREKDESPPGLQRLDRVENEPFESIQLFIDRDAERLEDACRRMNSGSSPRYHHFHQLCKFPCSADRLASTSLDDGTRDAARVTLLAIFEKDPRQLLLVFF